MFYIILRGTVKLENKIKRIEKKKKNRKEIDIEVEEIRIIGELSTGESFGQLALLEKKPRQTTITCISDCDFIILDKTSFD